MFFPWNPKPEVSMSKFQRLRRTLSELQRGGWTVANDGNEESTRYPTGCPEGTLLTVVGIDEIDALLVDREPMVCKLGRHPEPQLQPGCCGIAFLWMYEMKAGEWVEVKQ